MIKTLKPGLYFFFLFCIYIHPALGAEVRVDAQFQVVVNPANPTNTISDKTLADIFFKRVAFWSSNNSPILPVDLNPESPIRREFSDTILKRTVPAIRSYWQQQIYSGRGLPPVELSNEKDVISYVYANRDAIGYVSVDADLRGLKVVKIEAR